MGSKARESELRGSEEHDLGPLTSFPQGTPHAVKLGRRQIVLVRDGDQVHALRDVCPHQGAPLSKGRVISACRLRKCGVRWVQEDQRAVQCPWHGWAFGLKDGQALFDPRRVRVRSYSARVDEGRVRVRVQG